ncbi:MAG: ECF transporter S component [Oscillospiraceae bacterium]|nr:ECF transporter S component [Oscillospiraceae bacterium]
MKESTKTLKTNSAVSVKKITITAMFAAIVTVATAFIKIPSALGYAHPGDSMVYLAACVLPGPYGIIASSIGGAMADLISGYPQWILPTFIIKGLNAVPFVLCRMILKKRNKDNRIINLPVLLMLIPTTAVTVFGYFIGNWLLYDWAGAVAELATWWLQPGVGAVIFIAVGLGLDALKFKQKILPKFMR